MNATTFVVLQEGSKGAEVTKLQEDLKKLNFYSGIVDGNFGAKTKEAVINFQKSQQLVADGIVGEKTRSKLNAALNDPRFDFRVTNIQEFIKNTQIKVTSPKAVAAQLLSLPGEEDVTGFQEISYTYITREPAVETAVILYTTIGLGNDSVAGIRQRIELKSKQNKWEIVWIGEQYKCVQNRGHQGWSGSICH